MAGGDGWGFKARRELVQLCNFENLIDLWNCMNQRKKNVLNAAVMYSRNHREFCFWCLFIFYFDMYIFDKKNILTINGYYTIKHF